MYRSRGRAGATRPGPVRTKRPLGGFREVGEVVSLVAHAADRNEVLQPLLAVVVVRAVVQVQLDLAAAASTFSTYGPSSSCAALTNSSSSTRCMTSPTCGLAARSTASLRTWSARPAVIRSAARRNPVSKSRLDPMCCAAIRHAAAQPSDPNLCSESSLAHRIASVVLWASADLSIASAERSNLVASADDTCGT